MSQNILSLMIQDAKEKSLAQFELMYTGLYLYGTQTMEDEHNIAYKTDVISSADLRKLVAQSKLPAHPTSPNDNIGSTNRFIYEIRKKATNAFSSWISIGRAINNDIVLRYPTVSKLQALLEIEATSFGDPIGYQLIDNASTGKTIINGNCLKPNQATPIQPGDSILFGTVQCVIADAKRLWDDLR